ncbi:MAG: carboxylating nicotinate-nucleotide diphosphorylase [Myxococcota bacterium]
MSTSALVELALAEDIGPGDLTSALIPADHQGRAVLLAKTSLVFSGSEVFEMVFSQVDPSVQVRFHHSDGASLEPGTEVAEVTGPTRSLLIGERTALNFVQRLSGVATMARAASSAVSGSRARVVDTRKTTPGFRVLEKAAVVHGGAANHRFGLFDGVMVKDNHVDAMGGIGPAVAAARRVAHHLVKIEVEVRSLAELDAALEARADVVLLDNMDDATLRAAVEKNRGAERPAVLEASGGVTLERLPDLADTGVDLISMGALTHSAPAADLSLKYRS